jgi:hypothetical protein
MQCPVNSEESSREKVLMSRAIRSRTNRGLTARLTAEIRGDGVRVPRAGSPMLSGGSHGQMIVECFKLAAFAPNALGTCGTSGKNILRGPRLFNTDLSLLKDFRIN